jgi:DNA-directed RNA polymerase specialized sigma24 family protein
MSNIPKAREDLEATIAALSDALMLAKRALHNMTREKAAFRAKAFVPSLTPEQRVTAYLLREEGWALQRIATRLGTNIGRVSEVVNGKR